VDHVPRSFIEINPHPTFITPQHDEDPHG
jgi:hypothetical protein